MPTSRGRLAPVGLRQAEQSWQELGAPWVACLPRCTVSPLSTGPGPADVRLPVCMNMLGWMTSHVIGCTADYGTAIRPTLGSASLSMSP